MADRVEILRVGLDPTAVETGVRRARRAYSDLARGAQGVAAGSESASASLRRVAGQSDQTQRAVERLGRETGTTATSVRRLQGALAGLGIALGVREVAQYADSWRLIEGRLKLVTDSTAQLAAVQGRLFGIAQETRTSYEATAELYARVARNAEQLGRSQEELLVFTEATQKAIQVSGATAAESAAGVIQLSQALASGELRGEEFRSVSEQLPGILLALQQALGKTAGELREMAFAGQLTSDIVVQAMLDMKESIDRDFANVPVTIGQSFTVLNNEIQRFIGEGDSAHGVSRALSGAILTLANNLDALVTATGALATLYAGRWLADYAASTRGVIAAKRAEQAATVQASFAAQMEAAAYAETTAAKVRDTEATLANLTATRAAIQVSRQEALAQLQRARAVQAQAAAVPIASLAPLGGAAVARELARREAATRAVSNATRELAVLGQQQARVEAQITAATAAHTSAQTANAAAMGTATTAARAHAASLSLTTRAMAAATGAARVMWAAIGGPIGATLLGLWAAYEVIQRIGKGAREAADEARRGVQDFTASLRDMESAALRSERAALEFQLDALRRMRDATPQTMQVATGSFLNGGVATIRNPAIEHLDQQASALEQKLLAVNEAIEAIFAPRQRSADLTQDIRDAAEDMIRSAQQALELAGLDREAQSRRAIEHRAINKLIEAERDLSGEALEHMRAAIETERQLSLQAVSAAKAFERQEEAAKRIKEALGDMAQYTADVVREYTIWMRLQEENDRRQREREERQREGERGGMILTRRSPGRRGPSLEEWQAVFDPGALRGADDATRAITDGVRGLIDLGDAAGLLSDSARRALSGINNLASSIDSLRGANGLLGQIGAGLGVAGAIAGFASALFNNEAERERNRILERNNEALRDLARSLSGFRVTFDTMGSALTAAQSVGGFTNDTLFRAYATRELRGALASVGLTMDEFQQIIDRFGIEVFDSKGLLTSQEALEQFIDAVLQTRLSVQEFGKTFEGQRTLMEARREIFDQTDPLSALEDQFALFESRAGDLLRDFGLSNLNLDTETGRAVLENGLREIFAEFEAGNLTADQLGGFTSVQEFLDAIVGTDRALDSFTEGLQDAARAATDLPRSINLALFRSRVTQSAIDQVAGTPPVVGGPSGDPTGDPTRPGGRPPVEAGVGGGRQRPHIEGQAVYNLTFAPGSVVTQARNGEELLRDLEKAVKDARNQGRRVSMPGVRTEGM